MKLQSKKAIALLSVLWVIVILSVLSISLTRKLHFKKNIIKQKIDHQNNFLVATSAINYLKTILISDQDQQVDSINDIYYDSVEKFKDKKILEGIIFSIYNRDNKEKNAELRYGIAPVNSKLNINYLTKEIIEEIINSESIDPEKLACLLDWIDKDNDPNNNGTHGAENDYYQELDLPYKAPNKKLQNWYELNLIKKMDYEFASFLKRNFTIYGQGKININFADTQTLKWLGLSSTLITKIKEYLEYKVFTNINQIISDLDEFEYLTTEETSQMNKILPQITTKSTVFKAVIKPTTYYTDEPIQFFVVLKRIERSIEVVNFYYTI